jgi:hypothetical protein
VKCSTILLWQIVLKCEGFVKALLIAIQTKFFAARPFLLLASFAMFASCHAQKLDESESRRGSEYTLLGLVGYNYTDRHISNYSVDSAGGGNVNMSSPTSGGSGVTCCVKLSKKYTGPILVKVRWQVDGCIYIVSNPRTGATAKLRHFYYKEAEVRAQRVVGENPKYIETHFYPDGSVQVLLTENGSNPRLVLDGKRPDKSSFSRCKDDTNPEE